MLFNLPLKWHTGDKKRKCDTHLLISMTSGSHQYQMHVFFFGAELRSKCQKWILNSCDDPRVFEETKKRKKNVKMNHREMALTRWMRHQVWFFFLSVNGAVMKTWCLNISLRICHLKQNIHYLWGCPQYHFLGSDALVIVNSICNCGR